MKEELSDKFSSVLKWVIKLKREYNKTNRNLNNKKMT